jgi:plastocyanin
VRCSISGEKTVVISTMKHKLVLSIGTFMVLTEFFSFVGKTQSLPAPVVDRVGFPTGYQQTFIKVFTFDNYQSRSVLMMWANSTAASVTPATVFKFPYGSIIVMETYAAVTDANGNPVLDANGRFMIANGAVPSVAVMRKEKGFGVDYGIIRNGEWEYGAYHADGTTATPPSATGVCAACHLTGASANGVPITANSVDIGKQWDYVFRPELFAVPSFGGGSGAVATGVLQHYLIVPSTIHAQPGQVVTVYNDDQLLHHIVADDGSFDTGVMNPGASFTVTAGAPGTVVSYHCTLHSRMKGQVVVDAPQQ